MVTAGADKYDEVCLMCTLCVTRWYCTPLVQAVKLGGLPLGGGSWHVPVMLTYACCWSRPQGRH